MLKMNIEGNEKVNKCIKMSEVYKTAAETFLENMKVEKEK